eukprot:3940806-Rhodomonas_salina.1
MAYSKRLAQTVFFPWPLELLSLLHPAVRQDRAAPHGSSRGDAGKKKQSKKEREEQKQRGLLWGDAQERAFLDLKNRLASKPLALLRLFDQHLPTSVTTDACTNELTIGAALMEDYGDGFRPVAFYSRKLKDAELNYNTLEKELLAIKEALRVWLHFLIGCSFKVYCDHESLKYFKTMPDLSERLLCWLEFLAWEEFDFGCIQYLPGARNPVGNALSRIPGRPTSDPRHSKGDIIVSNSLLSDIGLATISTIKLLANPITRSATGTAPAPILSPRQERLKSTMHTRER